MPNTYPGNTTLSAGEQNFLSPIMAVQQDRSNKFINDGMFQNSPDFSPFVNNPYYGGRYDYPGNTQRTMVANPMFSNSNMGNVFAGNNNGGSSSGFSSGVDGTINNAFSGGGSQVFNDNTPEGFNPYQFTPTFQNLERPDSPVAGLEPEQEFLRQFMMGGLMGERPGEDAAYDQLMSTVNGDYLYQDSNPYITDLLNSLGEDTTNQLNQGVNSILSRAGVGGALGGSRAALMKGQAVGESTRGMNATEADVLNTNYQRERQNQLSAIPGLLDVEGKPVQRAAQAYDLASIPQQLKQQLIDAQRGELLRQQNERLQPIQVGQSVLGQRMGQTIPIVQQPQNPLTGLGALFSGIGSLGNAYNNMNTSGGGTGGGGTNNLANYNGGYAQYNPFDDGYGNSTGPDNIFGDGLLGPDSGLAGMYTGGGASSVLGESGGWIDYLTSMFNGGGFG